MMILTKQFTPLKESKGLDLNLNMKGIFNVIVPYVLIILGIVIMLGWLCEWEWVIKDEVGMKFQTALYFFIIGIVFIRSEKKRSQHYFLGWISGVLICFVISVLLGKTVSFLPPFALSTGVEIPTVIIPSYLAIFLAVTSIAGTYFQLYKMSLIIIIFAIIALLGHTLQVPILYGYLPQLSKGMAFTTSIGMLHVGAWMYHKYK